MVDLDQHRQETQTCSGRKAGTMREDQLTFHAKSVRVQANSAFAMSPATSQDGESSGLREVSSVIEEVQTQVGVHRYHPS